MRSKLSWIPFIVLLPAACFLKTAQSLFPGGLFGLSALKLEYMYLGCAALMLLFALAFCMTDKKIAAYYIPRRNIAAGVFALITALMLAADGAGVFIRIFSAGEPDALTIVGAVLSLVASIVFFAMGLGQIIRRDDDRRLSMIYALPSVMFAVRLILSFVSFTTISIRLADVSRLICYVFALMFFFYYAVVLSLIKTKNAVKMCLIFGFPAVVALIPYGVYHLIFSFDIVMIVNNAEPAALLFTGLYILMILAEISRYVLDRDSIEAVTEADELPDLDELAKKKVGGLIATSITEDKNDFNMDDSSLESRDTEGFLYQRTETPETDEYTLKLQSGEAETYLTEVVDEDPETRPKNYETRLDDVDQLLIEITEKID